MRENVRQQFLVASIHIPDFPRYAAHSLEWFRFIGRILGKALYEGILIDVAFAGFFLAKVCVISLVVVFFLTRSAVARKIKFFGRLGFAR